MEREFWSALGLEPETVRALKNMVRIGTVSEVAGQRVRVVFRGAKNMKSGWLTALQHVGELKPDDVVLVLYVPVFNGDGFVLGVLVCPHSE